MQHIKRKTMKFVKDNKQAMYAGSSTEKWYCIQC